MGEVKYKENRSEYSWERVWTKESLKWRLSRPNYCYKISHDTILAPTEIWGIESIVGKFDAEMLANNFNVRYKLNFNPLKLWIGIDKSVDWDRSLFYNIPKKIRPAPLNLIFKDLTGNNLKLNIDKVKFQGIDFDAY